MSHSLYNVPVALRLEGELDSSSLEKALTEIIRRHEALRTRFRIDEGEPFQEIGEGKPIGLRFVDVTLLEEEKREIEARRMIREEAEGRFELSGGPVMRGLLVKVGEDEHILVMVMHHIVSDGWSMGVLVREVGALYGAYRRGEESPLEEMEIQYSDYAVWQREYLSGEVLEEQLGYWRQQLEGAPEVWGITGDRPRPAIQRFVGGERPFEIAEELAEGLGKLSRGEGATVYMGLLAAFQTLLFRYTGERDILVGTPVANRNSAETEGLIGFFVNTLVMRTELRGELSFVELLEGVRQTALGAYAHQDLPFEKLVEELKPQRSLSYTPIFQVMFVLQNAPIKRFDIPSLRIETVEVQRQTAKYDLTLTLTEMDDGLSGSLVYNTDLFDEATIERLVSHFQKLLGGIVEDSKRRLSELPLLTEVERHQLLVEWNQSGTQPGNETFCDLFQAQARRIPNETALAFEELRLSFDELNRRTNQLARHLRVLGVGPEVRVGIYMDRGIEMIVAVLGILKAGGAYVPLDPAHPPGRLSFMLEDSHSHIVVTQKHLAAELATHGVKSVSLDADWHIVANHSSEELPRSTAGANLAYVI